MVPFARNRRRSPALARLGGGPGRALADQDPGPLRVDPVGVDDGVAHLRDEDVGVLTRWLLALAAVLVTARTATRAPHSSGRR